MNVFFCGQALMLKRKNDRLDHVEKISIRLHNHPESSIALKNLKAAYIGAPFPRKSNLKR